MAALRSEVSTQVVPYIFYRDVPAALEWLAKAFGFVGTIRGALPSGGVHGEMTFDGRLIMMGQGAKDRGMASVRETGTATQGSSSAWPMSMVIARGRARRGPKSSGRSKICPTGAAIVRATWKGTLGSSPRARPAAGAKGAGQGRLGRRPAHERGR